MCITILRDSTLVIITWNQNFDIKSTTPWNQSYNKSETWSYNLTETVISSQYLTNVFVYPCGQGFKPQLGASQWIRSCIHLWGLNVYVWHLLHADCLKRLIWNILTNIDLQSMKAHPWDVWRRSVISKSSSKRNAGVHLSPAPILTSRGSTSYATQHWEALFSVAALYATVFINLGCIASSTATALTNSGILAKTEAKLS